MGKVKVLGLRGCSWCNSLKVELYDKGIPFEFIDVDKEGRIADMLEELLDTENYPITMVQSSNAIVYIYMPDKATDLGTRTLPDGNTKIGCFNLVDILEAIELNLNK